MSFDIENMINTSNCFENKLNALAELASCSSGNKLGVKNEETYISWWYLQSIHRTFYSESIKDLLLFLKKTFDDYFIFNVMIRRAISNINDERLLIMRRENEEMIQKWKKGLIYLKNEYKKSSSIQKEIDELIIFLL